MLHPQFYLKWSTMGKTPFEWCYLIWESVLEYSAKQPGGARRRLSAQKLPVYLRGLERQKEPGTAPFLTSNKPWELVKIFPLSPWLGTLFSLGPKRHTGSAKALMSCAVPIMPGRRSNQFSIVVWRKEGQGGKRERSRRRSAARRGTQPRCNHCDWRH